MANYYWVGGTATWDATAGSKWADASGGTNYYATPPTSTDDVYFDASSGTVTVSWATSTCKNLDCHGFTGALNPISSAGTILIYGDIYFPSTMTMTASATRQPNLRGNTTHSLYSDINMPFVLTLSSTDGGEILNLASNVVFATANLSIYTRMNCSSNVNTINTNNYNITLQYFGIPTNGCNFNLGSSTINLHGTSTSDTDWNLSSSVNAGTSTINYNGTDPAQVNGVTFYNVVFNNNTTIVGSGTFNNLHISAGKTVTFTAGTTQTISSITSGGISGSLAAIQSSSAGTPFTLSDSAGTNVVNYMSIKDCIATGGATWDASNGTNTNGGNTTGWIWYKKILTSASYLYSGFDLILRKVVAILTIPVGVYNYIGNNLSYIYYKIVINIVTGVYTYTGNNWLNLSRRIINFNIGSYIYTGFNYIFYKTYAVIVNTGNYIYSGINWRNLCSRIFAFAKGTYTYTGFNWIMQKVFAFVFSTGSYTYNGFNFILKATRQFLWSTGAYAYTGFNWLNIRLYQLLINTGSYVYTGSNYLFNLTRYVLFNAGSYSVTGFNFIFTALRKIIIGTISYIYTGFNVRIKGTGDLAWLKKNNDDGQNWGKTIKDDGSNWSKSTLDNSEIWSETQKDSGSGWGITNKDSEDWTITPKN